MKCFFEENLSDYQRWKWNIYNLIICLILAFTSVPAYFIFLHKFSVSMLKSLIMIKACVYLTHKNTHLTWEFKYGKNFTSSWWKERRLKAFSYQSSFLVLMLADDRALKNVCIRKSERKLFHPYFSQRSKKKKTKKW